MSKKICQRHAFPRWVTLQPDSDYNPREKCKEKRKLDLEGITREIIDEISDNRRWETSQWNGGRISILLGLLLSFQAMLQILQIEDKKEMVFN